MNLKKEAEAVLEEAPICEAVKYIASCGRIIYFTDITNEKN
jgi:hypothetical protein